MTVMLSIHNCVIFAGADTLHGDYWTFTSVGLLWYEFIYLLDIILQCMFALGHSSPLSVVKCISVIYEYISIEILTSVYSVKGSTATIVWRN